VVIDSFKPYPVGSDALDEPVSLPVVDLPSAMSVADSLLDIGPTQMSFVKPEQGMSSPNEVFDRHSLAILRGYQAGQGV
jgi:hypothetical protein